jgi:hypothetical protein
MTMELAKKAFEALETALDMSDQVECWTFLFEPSIFSEENLARFTEPELKELIDAAEYYSHAVAVLENSYRKLNDVFQLMKRLSRPPGDGDNE